MTTAYITHPECLQHDMGEEHPEAPARLRAIEDRLIAGGIMDFLRYTTAQEVTREQLLAAHDERYVDSIFARAPLQDSIELDQDTLMNPHTLPAALVAAGAAVQGVDMVMRGDVDNAFCAVRPPGHHAERDRAMGFCLFNNVAVAAIHAVQAYGLERVAIVDFDVHHGNGTEHICRDHPNILYCSSYQHPFYPFSDPGLSHDNIVHIPLRAGSSSVQFREAIGLELIPDLDRYKPQLLLVSAGFDAHVEDPMADLNLSDVDYQTLTQELMDVAARHAEGRLVSVLEGGYNLSALGRAAFQHIKVLMGV